MHLCAENCDAYRQKWQLKIRLSAFARRERISNGISKQRSPNIENPKTSDRLTTHTTPPSMSTNLLTQPANPQVYCPLGTISCVRPFSPHLLSKRALKYRKKGRPISITCFIETSRPQIYAPRAHAT